MEYARISLDKKDVFCRFGAMDAIFKEKHFRRAASGGYPRGSTVFLREIISRAPFLALFTLKMSE